MGDILNLNKCVDEAYKGLCKTKTNPLVGAIVVNNGEIIGKGHHKVFGGNHAEVNAILDAQKRVKDLSKAKLYISLEPCSHTGKVGPCTTAIINSGIKTVVIGGIDPNPIVKGSGIKALRNANINVSLIENEKCVELNKIFEVNIRKERPYIHLKLAITKDFALTLKENTRSKITNNRSDTIIHTIRSKHEGIMVGAGTVTTDNPKLSARMKNRTLYPTKIVIDPKNRLNSTYEVFKGPGKTIHITEKCHRDLDEKFWQKILNKLLKKEGIKTILVEGGYGITKSLLKAQMIDEITIIMNKSLTSLHAPKVDNKVKQITKIPEAKIRKIGNDIWFNKKLG